MGNVTLTVITGILILVPYTWIKSLQLIWSLNTYWWHIWVPNLQMSYRDLILHGICPLTVGPLGERKLPAVRAVQGDCERGLTCGFLWSRWRGKRSRHSRRMRNPQFCVSSKRSVVSMLLAGWPRVFLAPGHLQQPWWLGPADSCHECSGKKTLGTQWNVVFKLISICCKNLQWIRIDPQRVGAHAQQLQVHLAVVMISKLLAPVCFSLTEREAPDGNLDIDVPLDQKISIRLWSATPCVLSSIVSQSTPGGNNTSGTMMTSSNGSIFRDTGPLCGDFAGHRWIPLTKASDAELWCFIWSAPE